MSELGPSEYRLLVEHSPVMVWRAGLDAKCDYFNDTWLAFTGRTLAQERGDGWAEGVHAEDFQRCVDYYLDHFARREAFEMEYRLRRHDGVYRWIFDRGAPYTDDTGAFAGFIGSCVDVDDRRRATDAREQEARDRLAFAHEFEQWILAIVSHDIRNPLGAIDASAKVLATAELTPEQVRRIAERVKRSTSRITSIVADLLDLSRERHGNGIAVAPARTDLAAVCRDVAAEIDAFTIDRTIRVGGAPVLHGTWDAARLTQAISNLVGNAVKHGTPGTPIELHADAVGRNAVVEVRNAGAIADDVLPKLFQPFAARALDDRKRDGLGLGLFIARSIVHAHGGTLEVDTDAARGTTFRITLPRVPA